LVMYYTSSAWSHMGVFTENGNIIDATTGGVIEHPLSDYFDGKSYIVVKRLKAGTASPESLAKGLAWGGACKFLSVNSSPNHSVKWSRA
jgi:cell wall-associated NlpC family hydrolase